MTNSSMHQPVLSKKKITTSLTFPVSTRSNLQGIYVTLPKSINTLLFPVSLFLIIKF